MHDDEELIRFKRLDLRLYAASLGFVIDKRLSWRTGTVMRRNDEKIIITQKERVFLYWNPKDDGDRGGTIIDFVGRYGGSGMNLGRIRQELRRWSNLPAQPLPHLPGLSKTSKNLEGVRRRYASMYVAERHAYLEDERRIPAWVLRHPRFAGRIKLDRYGAAVFVHTDADRAVCGYELKNRGAFTGFASGGHKGIFLSNSKKTDQRLVLTEGGIDALSHLAIFGDPDTRYGSIGGKLTRAQYPALRTAIFDMPGGSEIVAATDADVAGEALANELKQVFDACGRVDLTFRREEPAIGKDWNDMLRSGRHKPPLPFRPVEPRVS
jgi:hypothetical protein